MDLPTYTSIWRIEKRLYKLYDFRLPMPVPVGQIAVFAAITVPYVILLTILGLPFNHSLFWLYVLPPGVITWLATRPVLESKRLPELVISQVRYLGEPGTWCRMAPLAEKDDVVVVGKVWRRDEEVQRSPAEAPALAPADAPAPARRPARVRPAAARKARRPRPQAAQATLGRPADPGTARRSGTAAAPASRKAGRTAAVGCWRSWPGGVDARGGQGGGAGRGCRDGTGRDRPRRTAGPGTARRRPGRAGACARPGPAGRSGPVGRPGPVGRHAESPLLRPA